MDNYIDENRHGDEYFCKNCDHKYKTRKLKGTYKKCPRCGSTYSLNLSREDRYIEHLILTRKK